jgi:hypothetical protein
VTCGFAHVEMRRLFVPYLLISIKATAGALFVSIFCWVVVMARNKADAPVRLVIDRIRPRVALFVLPALILPLFLAGYTAAKTAIPFLVGFGWDGVWMRADRFVFGDDAWRIAQGWLGLKWMPVYAWFYTFGWGAVFSGATALVAINAKPLRVGVFFTAMFLTWLIGGWLMALIFSASGPIFTHLFDPALGRHFAPLRQGIAATLRPDNPLRFTQDYLAATISSHVAVNGGGVSAMPSMHLGAASIYIFAARRTKWLIPAVLFWVTIFLLSGYFGYHYWVDGLVAAAIAWACWHSSELLFGLLAYRPPPDASSAGVL